MKQNILITNDDGINAKGLRALIEVASEFGKVTIVAPEMGMSGMSHAITMTNPLFLRRIKIADSVEVYACQGTPVDCVKIAVDSIMEEAPTLILSGINHGSNSNVSVLYSGTMGAATEGATYNVPSIGFSLTSHLANADFTAARYYVKEILEKVLQHNCNKSLCLNVNIPSIPSEEIKGIKLCRQANGFWQEEFDKKLDPRGREYYWLVGKFINTEPEAADTDEWALRNGYVSIVPVQVDMTDYKTLKKAETWF
ncbi:MAG TPA: 5'/3'-nucleotidase SurE [Candidatus Avirikenella pullistercoris]|nr:5'/3'-nucleotidase SurE [Candidatus Avirikenella pullistercoris]